MDGFRRAVGAALLASLVAACGGPDAEPSDSAARTDTVPPSVAESSESSPTAQSSESSRPDTSPPPTEVDDRTADVPVELVGTWQSVDQGAAEDLIEIHADGTYLRAMLLMQQRPSGVFSFSIGTTGHVMVEGSTLRVVPASGTESMSDPDAPGANYNDRPLKDLTPAEYQWSMSDGSLLLDGQYGLVEFRPAVP